MSNVSNPGRGNVLWAVAKAFPHGKPASIMGILDAYGTERHERERERVQLAIVKLSQGDVGKLEELVGVAKRDYRDVLSWIELGEGCRDPFAERFYEALATPEATPTRLELLKEGVPSITRVAVFGQAEYAPHEHQMRELKMVSRRLMVELHAVNVSRAAEFEATFSAMARTGVDGLLILTCAMHQFNANELAQRALDARLPAISESSEFAAAGGLMSYGPSASERQRLASALMGQLVQTLEREPPITTPTLAPEPHFVINLKTAKVLRLTIPQSVLIRADQVLQ
jgi:hypothetical protein